MKRMQENVLSVLLSLLAMAFYLMPLSTGVAFGANDEGKVTQVTTKIKHKPISYFVAEKRIRLDAEVKDTAGIELVRCYFKGKAEADYVFVTMNQGDIGEYSAILPAPNQKADMIEYLFLAVNKSNQVVKTQIFNVKRNLEASKTPSWQDLSSEGNIKVGIELGEAPETLEGFSDSITMDIVESGLRFGFVAALYSSIQMAAAGGVGGGTAATAATATAGGTVTATSGLSTAVIVGLALGGAALVGGIAAAAGGGSSGGGGSSSGGSGTGGGTSACTTSQQTICAGTTCTNCSCAGNCATCTVPLFTGTTKCPTISATACSDTGNGYYSAGGRTFSFNINNSSSINSAAQACATYCVY